MNYTLKEPRTPLAGNPLLKEASDIELRVLLSLIELVSATPEELAKAALAEVDDVTAALQFWRGAGVVRSHAIRSENKKSKQENPENETPLRHENKLSLPGTEITAKLIDEKALGDYIDACQKTAGQIFNSTDIEIAVALCEQLGLEAEYILMLISHCYNSLGKRSMAYVEKVAFTYLLDLHLDTPDKLEAHLTSLELVKSMEGKLRRLLGAGARAFTSKEQAAFRLWLTDFNYGMPMLEAAYDKTVNATGKASVSYMNKILTRWHENGCKTVADAEALELREAEAAKNKKRNAASKKNNVRDGDAANISFNVDDFFERALNRSYGQEEKDKKAP